MTEHCLKGGAEMSKRNKRRFWQSQRSHLKAMLEQECTSDELFDIGIWDYHLEVYRTQMQLGRILSKQARLNIWYREVLPF